MDAVFQPPEVNLFMDTPALSDAPVRAVLYSIEQHAGAAVGNATVGYPANVADNPDATMGTPARIEIGNDVVFRGIVLHGPVEVNDNEDMLQLLLMDDKYLLTNKPIGSPFVGNVPDVETGTYGFTDVGFEVVFNADGKPDKDPAKIMFKLGPTAVFWTLRDVMKFIFQYYVSASVATLDAEKELARPSYDVIPSHLNLVGQTQLQAIETVAKMAGESWTLIPGKDASAFHSVVSGVGTVRTVSLFRPFNRAGAESATEAHAQKVSIGASIENCYDLHYCVSKNAVVEMLHTNIGSEPLLLSVSTSADKEWPRYFKVDVSKYETYGLGRNRTANATPRPWLKRLVTRLNAARTAYITAAQIVSAPALASNESAQIPIWFALDGNINNVVLLKGGYRIHAENGTIDVGQVDADGSTCVQPVSGAKIAIADEDWANVGIWMTVATDTGLPEIAVSALTPYLADSRYQVIQKPDIIPEARHNSLLPDLTSSDPNARTQIAVSAEEAYIDVGDKLQSAADFAAALCPQIETPLDITLPFFPVWQIGDRIAIEGRNLGATGNEVIDAITFDVYECFETRIHATNIMSAINPEQALRRRQ
jgi:hypothetical protein